MYALIVVREVRVINIGHVGRSFQVYKEHFGMEGGLAWLVPELVSGKDLIPSGLVILLDGEGMVVLQLQIKGSSAVMLHRSR